MTGPDRIKNVRISGPDIRSLPSTKTIAHTVVVIAHTIKKTNGHVNIFLIRDLRGGGSPGVFLGNTISFLYINIKSSRGTLIRRSNEVSTPIEAYVITLTKLHLCMHLPVFMSVKFSLVFLKEGLNF